MKALPKMTDLKTTQRNLLGCFKDAERPLEPWRYPRTIKAKTLVNTIISEVLAFEAKSKARKRLRKSSDQQSFDACVSAVVSDVVVNALLSEHPALFVSTSHRRVSGRYADPLSTRTLSYILKTLGDPALEILNVSIGRKTEKGPNQATSISAGRVLLERIKLFGIRYDDFETLGMREPIVLKSAKGDFWDHPNVIEYEDSEFTRKQRQRMLSINESLRSFDISYSGDRMIDLTNRQLRRIFTCGSFNSGGRLFGGFWQPMNKQERLLHLRINDEELVEVDYGQIMPRIMYSIAKQVPTTDDLYAIPGFEAHRPGIKKVMSSMQFVDHELTRFPKEVNALFPKGTKVQEVISAIEAAHPKISHLFYTGIGHRCQYIESNIMMSILETLYGFNVAALPVHDAVLVPKSGVAMTKRVMHRLFEHITGLPAVLDLKTLSDLKVELQSNLSLVA